MYRYIKCDHDRVLLQKDLDYIVNSINRFLLKLNVGKCKFVSYGRHVDTSFKYYINAEELENLDSIKDLGVTFDSRLRFDLHVTEKINKANSILGIIKRNFCNLSYEAFLCMYKSLVRSHLEYAETVWNPYRKELIEKIERVQMRATKLLPGLENLPYVERLKKLKLPTLKFRRIRGDIIELYKMINNKYDPRVCIKIKYAPFSSTRGNSKKIFQQHCKYDLRKHFFMNRVACLWNSLPEHVIMSSSINVFKSNLDHFWADQDVLYDMHADITGTGNRSLNKC